MRYIKTLLILLAIVMANLNIAQSQNANNGVLRLDDQRMPQMRKLLIIPDVNGNKVIKCDFHMHTVFSDGHVWPTIRIQEVWQEGLDAMSITEHREYSKKEVISNKNRPYEIIKDEAERNNIISIRGGEISRNTPPGHFNAIFLNDAEALLDSTQPKDDYDAIKAANEQGAFIFWNHPGWKPNIENSYEWNEFIQRINNEKMLGGIEVINGFGIHLKALDWCIEHNLAVMGTSDIHRTIKQEYNTALPYVNRTMTLVFATDRTEDAIFEALKQGKTVAWAGKYLAGKEEFMTPLFHSCVKLTPSHISKEEKNGIVKRYYEITNNSSLYFELELKEGKATKKVILYPLSSQIISADEGQSVVTYECPNTYIKSDKHLTVKFDLL